MKRDYDQLLSVQTTNIGRQTMEDSENYSPYEATPYPILSALFNSYQLTERDVFVDFGCGKGRILFYAHHLFKATVVGIEIDQQLYNKTMQNKEGYLKNDRLAEEKIEVVHCPAEAYLIQEEENKFYFFNPFTIEVFEKVIANILHSYEKKKRTVDLIFYYPWEQYIQYLKECTSFTLVKKIKVPGLYNINNNERFLIYRLHK